MPKYEVYPKRGKPKIIEAKNLKQAIAKAKRLGKPLLSIGRKSSDGRDYNNYYF